MLPDYRIALMQLRMTPHSDTTQELHIFKLSVLVGDVPLKQTSQIPNFMAPPQGQSVNGRWVGGWVGGGSSRACRQGHTALYPSMWQTAGRPCGLSWLLCCPGRF